VNGVVQVTISERDIQPKAVSIRVGEEVTIQVTSADSYHTFSIDELDINLRVGRGKTGAVTLTVDQPGTYAFYCRVTGHRGFGEEGKLVVK
jgi:heme/copper-type cytochrome/quinol oxidase subunit 2